MTDRPPIDWEQIERDYRAGIMTLRAIAAQHGISHVAVKKRADKHGWPRNLGARIRQKAEIELARMVAADGTVTDAKFESEIVDANAAMQVAIVREHQRHIQQARATLKRLMDDLGISASYREQLVDLIASATDDGDSEKRKAALNRMLKISEQSATLELLVRTLKQVISLEREAFGIDDNKQSPDDTYEAQLRKLYEQSRAIEPLAYQHADLGNDDDDGRRRTH